ncbi:DUF5675 family protein [Fibrobacter succinogenes]|uniref:DUF5675 family protein n=1 Tax=Fibrobacter succinogenes TaxID=833 RepID=UPI00156967D8|nr:DUF5675 family protein [Fibrobacter succinogenes]
MKPELVLIRTGLNYNKKGVFGELYLNNHFVCWTLENRSKLIPAVGYCVKNSQSPKFKRELPLLYNRVIQASRGIRIHVGNDAVKDSNGCILVGMMRDENKLMESAPAETMVAMLCRNCDYLLIVEPYSLTN